jgi:hypothetical protein
MRKTLVVLVLMIGFALVLQAPAWAPKLYSLERWDTDGGTSATFTGRCDCAAGETITIAAEAFASGSATATVKSGGTFTLDVTLSSATATVTTIKSVRCNKTGPLQVDFGSRLSLLPKTGLSVPERLAFGVALLAAGGLLVALSLHPRRGRPRNRRTRPTMPGP